MRSTDQWAELARSKADATWHGISNQRLMQDISGNFVWYARTGSLMDGWAEYFKLTAFQDPHPKVEDILFVRRAH